MPVRPPLVPMQRRPRTPSEKQLCLYISKMCSELRDLAKRPGFRTVNYLLDMARLEAELMCEDVAD